MEMCQAPLLRGLTMRRLLQQHQRIRNYASAVPTAADFQSFHPSSSASAAAPAGPSAESVAKTLAAQAESQTKQAERTLKRFWKEVTLAQDPADGSWSVLLDKRILKTPSGKKLALPAEKRAAALVIAHEWDRQNKLLKPHSLPMVRRHQLPKFHEKHADDGCRRLLWYQELWMVSLMRLQGRRSLK